MVKTTGFSVEVPPAASPLSWEEARVRLRLVLEHYLAHPLPTVRTSFVIKKRPTALHESLLSPDSDGVVRKMTIPEQLVDNNMDLYAGALAVSVALLIFASFSLYERKIALGREPLRPAASLWVYRGQIAASLMLVSGSLLSLWMMYRRRFLCVNDGESAKKREIHRYLRAWDEQNSNRRARSLSFNMPKQTDNDMSILQEGVCGTSLTDIYPVYRKDDDGDYSAAAWTRIPSLLLVKDDLIALQVGDVVPAPCVSVDDPSINLTVGSCIETATLNQSTDAVLGQLPRGRTTLSDKSEHLLTMCNQLRLYRVSQAPLHQLIRQKLPESKSPQIWRQMNAVRSALLLAFPFFLILSTIAVFVRPKATTGDLSLVLPLPLLASLGVLPLASPSFIFFLEVLGTARILTTVHPHAKLSIGYAKDIGSRTLLLTRYICATALSRLALWAFARKVQDSCLPCIRKFGDRYKFSDLLRIPPASLNLLEKFGVATAFALVDDELACDPHAIPQQLLIPSAQGLKLLDLCPIYDEEDGEDDSMSEAVRKNGESQGSDSDSDDENGQNFQSTLRRKVLRRRRIQHRKLSMADQSSSESTNDSQYEVQFEDPLWWHYLPSLKGIGLSCLVVDAPHQASELQSNDQTQARNVPGRMKDNSYNDDYNNNNSESLQESVKQSLVDMICDDRRSYQLKALAECIGFDVLPNSFGSKGDISPFTEKMRLLLLSNQTFRERIRQDAHERSSINARWWGLVRPDAYSVVVQDNRSKANQLLTVGDPTVVMTLCNEAWQGEISTILPLTGIDRATIQETSKNWKLSDLDVLAFSYSPVSRNFETLVSSNNTANPSPYKYLLDNAADSAPSVLKDRVVSDEWALIKNQIFLGLLGSLVVPRREIQKLLSSLSDAGVRFVYFSPRNMRRQKELASQMGIDVSWNCAISLRTLESGESDPHRMVSNYADWSVNAKLPHGINDVRKHLQEVDNVPLLVSLFTDVTKTTTAEMIEIFQEYSDTVITIGLSHLSRNSRIFATSDIAVGIDVLGHDQDQNVSVYSTDFNPRCNSVLPLEVEFVCAMASHSCAFRFNGTSSLANLPAIIEQGRAALEASISAVLFLAAGSLSFSFFVLFSVCVPITTIPFIPTIGAVMYLQIILPFLGFTMALSESDDLGMERVPPKNDRTVVFGRREGRRLYTSIIIKAILPALLTQILHFIAFGELLLQLDADYVEQNCGIADSWVDVIRCDELRQYSGPARIYSGALVFTEFVVCNIVGSASFVRRFLPITVHPPWRGNQAITLVTLLVLLLTVLFGAFYIKNSPATTLPWYFYCLCVLFPIMCLVCNEYIKLSEAKHEKRTEKLRRLQFETRLGAWSPR